MKNQFEKSLNKFKAEVAYASLLHTQTEGEEFSLSRGMMDAPGFILDEGYLITVYSKSGGLGYSSSSDTTESGVMKNFERALRLSQRHNSFHLHTKPITKENINFSKIITNNEYQKISLKEKLEHLSFLSNILKKKRYIQDYSIGFSYKKETKTFIDSNNNNFIYDLDVMSPELLMQSTNKKNEAVSRTIESIFLVQNADSYRDGKGIWSKFKESRFLYEVEKRSEELKALKTAKRCPQGEMDLIILPEQMALQIHESIGHALEYDRILGDERNYAGTSFVTKEMIETNYVYGSPLLNIVADPLNRDQLAYRPFDDEANEGSKQFIIENGVLKSGIGGERSLKRLNLDKKPVASSISNGWARPPIDRIGNLNMESGSSTLEQMVSSVKEGIMMDTPKSWSIDDKRHKFQFTCEIGYYIKDGKIQGLVKNPSYRGVTPKFWQSLSMVGNHDTYQILSLSNCGKGEMNQMQGVGHACPAALFKKVEIFGGDK